MADVQTDPFAGGANPFAAIGYDGGIASSGGSASSAKGNDPFAGGANPFAAIGHVEPEKEQLKSSAGSIATNFAAGTNEGVTGLIGVPVDLVNYGLKKIGLPVGDKPFLGSNWLHDQEARYGGNPDAVQSATEADRIARGAGAGVASAIVPAMAAEGLGASALAKVTGAADAGNAIIGGAAGAGGQAASDAVPEPYKPLASLAGGMASGIVPVAGYGALQGAKIAASHVPPLTAASREAAVERAVGSEIAQAGGGAANVRAALDANPDLVPGSAGTLAQRAPDLAQWEDAVRTQNKGPFIARAAAQNAARTEYLGSVQEQGNPHELTEGLKGQQAAADSSTAANVGAAQKSADANKQLADAVTGGQVKAAERAHASALDALRNPPVNGSPSDVAAHFRAVRDALQTDSQAAVDSAITRAGAAADAISGQQFQSVEEGGRAIRGPAVDALAARKLADSLLYDAAKIPDSATVPASPITAEVKDIRAGMTPEDRPMDGEEKRLFDLAGSYGDEVSFNRLKSLRSSILDEAASARRENPGAYRRLNGLRASVEDAMDHAVENRAALDQIAVNRGTLAPEDAITARVNKFVDDRTKPQSAVEANRNSTESSAGRGTAGDASVHSPEGAGNGGFRNLAGAPGVRSGTSPEGGTAAGRGPNANGGLGEVHYPGGSVGVKYEVADHKNLVTSHDADFNVRRDYPAALQPRARDSAASRDQVQQIASRLNPDRLGPSPEANTGAPVVGPDNVVESGNGRTLAIGKAYDLGKGEAYRKNLEAQGYDTSGMEKPILIARRTTPLDDSAREYFAHSANTSTGLKMSAAEQAGTDAKFLTPDVLSTIRDGGLAEPGNRDFVKNFMAKLPSAERAGFIDKDGAISQQGARRLEAAVASKAYGDDGFVSKAFDSYDPNIKGISGALTDAAGPWAKMREAASKGGIAADHDVTPDLMDAVKLVAKARDEGTPIANVLAQTDMFKDDTSSLVKRLLLRADGTGIASRDAIAANLKTYAEEALKNEAGPRLFGEASAPKDILQAALAKTAKDRGPEPALSLDEPAAPQGSFAKGAGEQPKPATAPVTPEQVAALKKANASYREQRETFGEGPLGDILEKKPRGADFELSNAEVPKKIFHAGPTGGEDVRAYIKAVGADKANPVLNDLASFMLHEKAFDAGVPNPAKISKWIEDHKAALAELPPDVRSKFETVASAQTAVSDALTAKRQRLDEFDRSAAAKVAGLEKSSDIVDTVGGFLSRADGAKAMGEQRAKAAGNPAAENGLKQAVVEYVLGKFVPDVSNPRISALRDFLASKSDSLKSAGFSDDEIAALDKRAAAVSATGDAATAAAGNREAAIKAAETQGKAAVKQAQADRAAVMDKYETGIVGRLVKANGTGDILDAIRETFNGTNPGAKMADLAKTAKTITGGEPALHKAIAQMIEREFTSTAEAGATGISQLKGAPFQKFVRDKADVMRAAGLTDEQIGKLSAIVQDQQRAARSINNAKLSGQSNTTPDALNILKNGGTGSILSHLSMAEATKMMIGAVAGSALGGPVGAFMGGIGAKAMGAMQEAGLSRMNELRLHAALNPEFAKALLEKVPQLPDRGAAALVALRARQMAVAGVNAYARAASGS